MAGFIERFRKWRDEGNALYAEAETFYEGGRARTTGERRRGRPVGSGTRSAAPPSGGGETLGKVSPAQLAGVIAQRYPNGASDEEIRQILGYKATAPLGNVLKQGGLTKIGDRYMPTPTPGVQAAA